MISIRPAPRMVGVKLTTTTQTTLFTASGDNLTEIVEWIHVGNVTGSPADFTLEWTDSASSTTFKILGEEVIAANDHPVRLELGVQLAPGDVLLGTADTANALEVILAVTEMGRSS